MSTIDRSHELKLIRQEFPSKQPSNSNKKASSKGDAQNNNNSKTFYVVGCDEAGRGPCAGPVVAAAVVQPFVVAVGKGSSKNNLTLPAALNGLGDSKELPVKTRDRIEEELKHQCNNNKNNKNKSNDGNNEIVAYSTCRVEASEIDQLNILEASLHGMERCVDDVLSQVPAATSDNTLVLVDGPHLPRSLRPQVAAAAAGKKTTTTTTKSSGDKKPTKEKKLTDKQKREAEARSKLLKPIAAVAKWKEHIRALPVIKGDSLCSSIAAASVLAKTERDRIMVDEVSAAVANEIGNAAAAEYDLVQNKGYPTAKHLAALSKHGPTKQHRKSFAPVAEAAEKHATKAKKKPAAKGKRATGKKAAAGKQKKK